MRSRFVFTVLFALVVALLGVLAFDDLRLRHQAAQQSTPAEVIAPTPAPTATAVPTAIAPPTVVIHASKLAPTQPVLCSITVSLKTPGNNHPTDLSGLYTFSRDGGPPETFGLVPGTSSFTYRRRCGWTGQLDIQIAGYDEIFGLPINLDQPQQTLGPLPLKPLS